MSFSKAVSSKTLCNGCKSAFSRSKGGPTASNASITTFPWTAAKPLPRTFASTATRREIKPQDAGYEFLDPLVDSAPSSTTPKTPTLENATSTSTANTVEEPQHEPSESSLPIPPPSSHTPETSSLPWYLQPQNRPDLPSESPTRALIPDLPPNPPPLLQTLLEHISLTLGLDDLLLLDLRHLDPPPALGPKLLMILGTARSEKHLHVSADRFCRHLRREYGLRADAAGLLGRNELKIKLRRKAKRMKMLANVGGREEGNVDDGIRTGWICCTVGRIEAHEGDTSGPGAGGEGFVGFREVSAGVNVVVQMFTEEKRGEIDLETLWGGVLRTRERQAKEADRRLEEMEEGEEEDEVEDGEESKMPHPSRPVVYRAPSEALPTAQAPVKQWNRPTPTKGDFFPPASSANPGRQLRRLHTVGL
ncbi:hypothetical protein EJ04DRAFT_551529 [Polyplosphaeria fusca]|uniref:ATPase synthesis protein 25 n=1 Tax=Polyplosphaeria fusca TaxID=682080 RepID=A0A9P4R3J4_9PLEO|nr:hypothetical protein EJ04DRAFT_551529 [Polyplosphaeria fusca]